MITDRRTNRELYPPPQLHAGGIMKSHPAVKRISDRRASSHQTSATENGKISSVIVQRAHKLPMMYEDEMVELT